MYQSSAILNDYVKLTLVCSSSAVSASTLTDWLSSLRTVSMGEKLPCPPAGSARFCMDAKSPQEIPGSERPRTWRRGVV